MSISTPADEPDRRAERRDGEGAHDGETPGSETPGSETPGGDEARRFGSHRKSVEEMAREYGIPLRRRDGEDRADGVGRGEGSPASGLETDL